MAFSESKLPCHYYSPYVLQEFASQLNIAKYKIDISGYIYITTDKYKIAYVNRTSTGFLSVGTFSM